MRTFKYTLIGFLLFAATVAFNVTLGIVVYSFVKEEGKLVVGLVILATIFCSSLICTIIDYFRRKYTVARPLEDILDVTRLMAQGNFKVRLSPYHSYNRYDEFDRIIDNLNKMAEELSKSEMLKNDFIANVSHEIKTPLSIIQNYAKVLNNDNLSSEERKKYLSNLQNACQKLSNLVSNILKLNKLENQKLRPEITDFNLSELLANQIIQYEELISHKNIELECDIEEDLFIKSEESYLSLVFNNLISNAIKFTNENGLIKISLKKKENNYIIKFEDNGCGMDAETGKHIFDKFYQGDTSHSKEGNGLGLALVKRVIDILGGSIDVKSELNVGTSFKIVVKGE